MELELGFKLTRTRDDEQTSMADFRITTDSSGPIFVSEETDSKFILTGYLKGFRRENIDIMINEAGDKIAISGKKPVQEMVLMGWIVQKKEVEIRAFRKVFQIPNGVILDKVKAKFNEETSNLTIFMPKSVKGHSGIVIEEVNEEEVDRGMPEAIDKIEDPEMKPVAADEVPEKGTNKAAPKEEIIEKIEEKQDPGQAEEPENDQRTFETTESAAEEIPENGKTEGAEEKFDGGESRPLENGAEAETERVEQTIREESKGPEVKSKEENERVAEESPGRTETVSSKPDGEAEISKITEPLQTEETWKERLPEEKAPEPGFEAHVPGPEMAKTIESGDDQSSLATQVEEKHTASKDHHRMESEKPEDLQKQEPCQEVEELTKPEEPCQVPEPEETPNPNEIEEKPDEQESKELEKQKGINEDAAAAQIKKHVSKKNKVCPPLVVAGSALLVSLIVLVFQLIRAKKR
ncbi:hypothetical protein AB3S75_011501 [Citrus x aurantiifolia]